MNRGMATGFVGVSIENGRVLDREGLQLKSALKEIVQRFHLPMRVTPNQSVILYDIKPEHKDEIQAILTRSGIQKETDIDPLVRYAMACPALPLCGFGHYRS